jgi:hypothetical protein
MFFANSGYERCNPVMHTAWGRRGVAAAPRGTASSDARRCHVMGDSEPTFAAWAAVISARGSRELREKRGSVSLRECCGLQRRRTVGHM